MTKRKPLSEFLHRALAAGRSQTELARELGVSRSAVSKWVTGQRKAPERFRSALRAAARPGWKVPTAPAQTTKSGTPVKTAGTPRITKLPSGGENIYTHARSAFARELARVHATGNAPNSFSVQLHDFRAADSPKSTPGRTRTIEVRNLTDAEIRGLTSGRKDILEDAITRAVQASRYTGDFTFRRATRFSFDTTP